MHPILRNILAVIAGLVLGSVVNMGIIYLSPLVLPIPEGADISTPETIKASIHLFEPRHYIMPFLAHALGTFVGALVAACIATNNKMRLAMLTGAIFLIGGISAVAMIPAPMWFNVTDLVCAYLPMAFIAGKIMGRKR